MAENKVFLIDYIVVDPELQARGGIDWDHVADIADAIKSRVKIKRPRVIEITDIYDPDRCGIIYAIDQHRIKAYEQAGRKEIPVVKLTGTWQDARDLATSANVEHNALKRSRQAKERAVQMCWEDHPDWTPGRVAKHCHVSGGMAKEWMASVPAAAAVPQEKRVGLDGKKRRQPKPSKNGKPKPAADDPDRFQPILSAFQNVSRLINEAMNGEGGEKLLQYLTYYKLINHPGARTAVEGDTVTPEPKFKGWPALGFILRAAALPGRTLTHEELEAKLTQWKQEREASKFGPPTRS